MVFIIYLLLSLCVIWFSIKLSFYVDELDKKTKISGAFLGGVMLAVATSLPELLTSIASTVFLDEVNLATGNILGSNIFNLTIYGFIVILGIKEFKQCNITSSHRNTLKLLISIYVIVLIANFIERDFTFFGVSFFSIGILILYLKGAKKMSIDESSDKGRSSVCELSVRQILIRFFILSIGLIISSVYMTIVTDVLAIKLKLSSTLAGSLLLGIVTSLPELTASITLIKKGNFNAMTGNILGSNLFNCGIFFLVDILYIKGTIYKASTQGLLLIFFGLICTIATYGMLKFKHEFRKVIGSFKWTSIPLMLASLTVILSYLTYITMSI